MVNGVDGPRRRAQPERAPEAISAAKVQLLSAANASRKSRFSFTVAVVLNSTDIGLFFGRTHALNTLYGDEAFTRRFSDAASFRKA